MSDARGGELISYYTMACSVHTALNSGETPKTNPGMRHTARFLNLPCPETYAVLLRTWPELRALEQQTAAHIPEGLVEQWNRHHSLLRGTWERLQGLAIEVETTADLTECLEYLREAGVRPHFWRSARAELENLIGRRYEAFRCLFDCVCIRAGKADAPVHLNGFGMPCSKAEAGELPVHVLCADFPVQYDVSNDHTIFRGGNI